MRRHCLPRFAGRGADETLEQVPSLQRQCRAGGGSCGMARRAQKIPATDAGAGAELPSVGGLGRWGGPDGTPVPVFDAPDAQ